jgi:hypothetical protein
MPEGLQGGSSTRAASPTVCHVFLEHFSTTATHTPHITYLPSDLGAIDALRVRLLYMHRTPKRATRFPQHSTISQRTAAQSQDIGKRRHSCAQRQSFDAGPEHERPDSKKVHISVPTTTPFDATASPSLKSFQPSTTARSALYSAVTCCCSSNKSLDAVPLLDARDTSPNAFFPEAHAQTATHRGFAVRVSAARLRSMNQGIATTHPKERNDIATALTAGQGKQDPLDR